MHEEIGTLAGVIWQALDGKSALALAQLKKEVKGKSPLFDWAIGWLAREDKIVLTPAKRIPRPASDLPYISGKRINAHRRTHTWDP